jgi:hypothetical protein
MTATMPFNALLLEERSGSGVRDLHRDQRGAIMLMGLCMACFLIGSLWFLIGIGDAIVFRDNMQEAADHAVFTSAILHAKGMNFISAMNLIMLALVFFHILLGIVNDVLFLACCSVLLSLVACPLWVDEHEIYVNYSNSFMKPACTGIHIAEVVAAYGYPWLGAFKGYTLGNDYGEFGPKKHDLNVIVLSPSMIPGNALDSVINLGFKNNKALQRTAGNGSKAKLGLPVQNQPFYDVCKKVLTQITSSITSLLGLPSFADRFIQQVIGGIGQFRYCNPLNGGGTFDSAKQLADGNKAIGDANAKIKDANAKLPAGSKQTAEIPTIQTDTGGGGLAALDPALDKWWGNDGPLYPWDGTSNGSPWQEVWSMNLKPDYADAQEHRVAVGGRKFGQTATNENAFAYFAEAEFYFDCSKKWGEPECNNEGGLSGNAAYAVQWRARIRRLELPEIGTLLGSYIGNFIANLKSLEEKVKELKLDAVAKALPLGKISGLAGVAVDAAFEKLKDVEQNLAKKVGGLANPGGLKGSYH